ncbi:hypothetical protein A1O3_07188 [Capronia epimyces CBS 606.96]|uniref:Transcription factor domain-containing protein n=1 Tax=Capronia epimyces CBS 606.96 TaxID=1182542 RepID=W9XUA4_9EURO|nr:uncharacterized protein A1O3_07188 [Capronia epimyces CBS 606.96]EXJ80900.1 hypothetical protein A1O3_07188 [Capronia epimyces CBS 606.96]
MHAGDARHARSESAVSSFNTPPHVPEIESLHDSASRPAVFIQWQADAKFFLSTERALLQSSTSRLMLQHFLHVTCIQLAAKPLRSNPFLTHVMPIACCDDLLMHAVLALSGSHIGFQNSGSPDIRKQTEQHYSFVISSLRHEFSHLSSLHRAKNLRLLLVLMVLCHVEVGKVTPRHDKHSLSLTKIVSDVCEGAMFAHLRASRFLILKLRQQPDVSETAEDREIRGFVLEVYAYLVSVAHITPYGTLGSSTLPVDDFVTSLGPLHEFNVFGSLLGCGSALFEKIPLIAQLYRQRLEERSTGQTGHDSLARCNELLASLKAWKSPPLMPDMAGFQADHDSTGEMYRQALLIYLELAIHGSPVVHPKLIYQIQNHIDTILSLRSNMASSPYESVLMWPAMMVGSCLIKEDQRQYTLNEWLVLHCRMNHFKQAITLLKLLWEDEDEAAYGPLGLHLMMHKHSIKLCMA